MARADADWERSAALSYIAESIRLHAQGRYYAKSLEESLRRKPRDARSAEEIAASVIKDAGLVVM